MKKTGKRIPWALYVLTGLSAVIYVWMKLLPGPDALAVRPADNGVYMEASDNKGMNDAMEKARKNIGVFIKHLQEPGPHEKDFYLKVRFEKGKDIEHIWVGSVKYESGMFYGELDDDPVYIKEIPGYVTATVEDVSDWMFVSKGKLVGGYTIKELRKSMTKEEIDEFDEGAGYIIE